MSCVGVPSTIRPRIGVAVDPREHATRCGPRSSSTQAQYDAGSGALSATPAGLCSGSVASSDERFHCSRAVLAAHPQVTVAVVRTSFIARNVVCEVGCCGGVPDVEAHVVRLRQAGQVGRRLGEHVVAVAGGADDLERAGAGVRDRAVDRRGAGARAVGVRARSTGCVRRRPGLGLEAVAEERGAAVGVRRHGGRRAWASGSEWASGSASGSAGRPSESESGRGRRRSPSVWTSGSRRCT